MDPLIFSTKSGLGLPAVAPLELGKARATLIHDVGISPEQMVEAASYSMAMVVRFALGLSADGGRVAALVRDNLAGHTALATIRHLVNSNSDAIVFYFGELPSAGSDALKRQLAPLEHMGVQVLPLNAASKAQALETIASCHNLLFGLCDIEDTGSFSQDKFLRECSADLNEMSTPIHAVELPSGIHPTTGAATGEPIFASSTISLGAAVTGTYHAADNVGRHYVCDISLTKTLYTRLGIDSAGALFAEQPVVQIFPSKELSNQESAA